MTVRALGYVRVSTGEQAKEGFSLDVQEKRVRAYCEAKGWDLVRIYRDEGVSAKSLDRPALHELFGALKAKEADALVVMKLDRLTRSMRDLQGLIEDCFRRDGIVFVSVDETLDTSTANGRMVTNVLGTLAAWEREVICERTKAALDHKATLGEWRGRIPFGFKVGADGKLIEDADAMKTIAAIKRSRRRSGTSYPKLAAQYGLSVGTVHKIVSTDLRVLRREVAA